MAPPAWRLVEPGNWAADWWRCRASRSGRRRNRRWRFREGRSPALLRLQRASFLGLPWRPAGFRRADGLRQQCRSAPSSTQRQPPISRRKVICRRASHRASISRSRRLIAEPHVEGTSSRRRRSGVGAGSAISRRVSRSATRSPVNLRLADLVWERKLGETARRPRCRRPRRGYDAARRPACLVLRKLYCPADRPKRGE